MARKRLDRTKALIAGAVVIAAICLGVFAGMWWESVQVRGCMCFCGLTAPKIQ